MPACRSSHSAGLSLRPPASSLRAILSSRSRRTTRWSARATAGLLEVDAFGLRRRRLGAAHAVHRVELELPLHRVEVLARRPSRTRSAAGGRARRRAGATPPISHGRAEREPELSLASYVGCALGASVRRQRDERLVGVSDAVGSRPRRRGCPRRCRSRGGRRSRPAAWPGRWPRLEDCLERCRVRGRGDGAVGSDDDLVQRRVRR